tara:strand:+ start:1767 stop:2438 length:672 start_codon:yes stop_codon:yes gene_type:complete
MIPKTIHQIFIQFKGGKKLNAIPDFCWSQKKVEKWCKENQYIYKLWDESDCYDLIREDYPEYEDLWDDFRFEIQKCDFIRYLILHRYGGIYLDLDIYPIRDMTELFEKDYFFTRWTCDKQQLPYIAVMGSEANQDIFQKIAEHCKTSTYEKQKMDIYQKWTGRLVFQSTGHFMVHRVLKKNKIGLDKKLDIVSVYNPNKKIVSVPPDGKAIFMDGSVSVWYNP